MSNTRRGHDQPTRAYAPKRTRRARAPPVVCVCVRVCACVCVCVCVRVSVYVCVCPLPKLSSRSRCPLPRGRYYSLDVGAVHLLAINTESPIDIAEIDEAQRDWIAEDLRRAARCTTRQWTIAFGHRPLYTTEHRATKRGTGYLRARLEDMFVASGVDLVVQGHVHAYQRSLPVAHGVPTANGYMRPGAPVYVVNGGAGNREANEVLPMGLPWEPAPNASAGQLPLSNEISFGISTISAGEIRWEQFFSSNGTRFDHFEITK